MARPKVKYCTTCGVHLAERGFVRFPCPSCFTELGRCINCRQQSNSYTCSKCGFEGP
ncbi:MAG: HVO_2753 family zinc finger protein [Methanohalobium sp.]|uniref:HVO_2753 family zinc finger protein n=1 Tax=Methanohalobium sp. TaxID=2837493 RepID=UPI00397E06D6